MVAAARAGYPEWWRILGVAVAVSLVGSGLEVVADHYVNPSDAVLSVGAGIASTGISLIGTVLLSGFVCRLVSVAEHAREPQAFLPLVRTLPWRRLIAADLLVALATVIGLLLLVVPGLIAVTLLAVIGPVMEIEHLRVRDAARRSAWLSRRHFWCVFLLATVPFIASGELESVAPHPGHVGEIAEFLIIRGVAEGVVEACIALVIVELAFQLVRAEAPADGEETAHPTGEEDRPADRGK